MDSEYWAEVKPLGGRRQDGKNMKIGAKADRKVEDDKMGLSSKMLDSLILNWEGNV